jgi:hypothetical protein
MREQAKHVVMTATIANGQTTSQALAIQAYRNFGLQLPAAFTGASIKFQVSADNVTYQDLYDRNNTLVSVTVVQGRSYDLPGELADWAFVKIVSASAEGADRALTLIAKS